MLGDSFRKGTMDSLDWRVEGITAILREVQSRGGGY